MAESAPKRYEVEDVETGDRFGNHTYAEACSRARIMRRNWNYKKVFVVKEALSMIVVPPAMKGNPMSVFCARSKPRHSYFIVMEDRGNAGLEAIVHPEDTRSAIVARIKSGEYEHIAFIHFADDLYLEDVTDDLINQAEAELKEEQRLSRAERQAAQFDHQRDLIKHGAL